MGPIFGGIWRARVICWFPGKKLGIWRAFDAHQNFWNFARFFKDFARFLKFCPISTFCPIFNILPNFQNFARFSKFCPFFKILPVSQNFAWFSKFCSIFKILPHFQNFAPHSKFCLIFKILQCHWFQAWCCSIPCWGFCSTSCCGSCRCHRGGGWPEWGQTGLCAGCTGPCGNTSWLSTANLCCSDDANTGISDGTALVIVNIWNLIWTWYSLKSTASNLVPGPPIWGFGFPWWPISLHSPFSLFQASECVESW